MENKKERIIIFSAVRKACKNNLDRSRKYIARLAAFEADKRHVNVVCAPYLENIFIEALDKKESAGVFSNE